MTATRPLEGNRTPDHARLGRSSRYRHRRIAAAIPSLPCRRPWRWRGRCRSGGRRQADRAPAQARCGPAVRQGQARGAESGDRRGRGRSGAGRRPAQPRAAAQPRTGLGRQGAGPHRADPRDLQRPRRHARGRAAGRDGRAAAISARGWCAPGPISSGSAAGWVSSAAPARRRSRPTAAPSTSSSCACAASCRRWSRPAPCTAPRAPRCRSRSWRSWATPMPENRRCSTT